MGSSLYAGVTGLMNQQTQMDVIGNDIANVNTTGFKSSRVSFSQGFDQLLQAASLPTATGGGTNPEDIGLGSRIGSIDTVYTQGTLDTTGVNTDLAIQGNSMFVLSKGNEQVYTRDGDFVVNADGGLVTAAGGLAVQGRMAVNGKLSGNLTNILLPTGETVPANATSQITFSGNLDASAPVFDSGSAAAVDPLDPTQTSLPQNVNSFQDLSITAYDSLGNKQNVKVVLWKTGTNTWDWEVDPSSLNLATGTSLTETAGTHPIPFTATGTIDTSTFTAPTITFSPADGSTPLTITMNMTNAQNGLTQFAGSSSAVISNQDGYAAGTLQSYAIDSTGTITGSFSNGTSETLGQVALADFNNPGGLQPDGNNTFGVSPNSGPAIIGYAGSGATSTITSGSLEESNVNLAQEFTGMIVAQRGYEANAKVITTADQMLQALVNLRQ
ncbi:MAG TPA: flagellar hook protein FlgE [Gemmatimonadaceae bacterium]|nr:flagellar hook protein FlgE [Gemmatimonadaceae bacterium]